MSANAGSSFLTVSVPSPILTINHPEHIKIQVRNHISKCEITTVLCTFIPERIHCVQGLAIQVDNTVIPPLRGRFLGLRASSRSQFQSRKAHCEVKLPGLRTRIVVLRNRMQTSAPSRQYSPTTAPNMINALLRSYSGFFEAL